MNKKIIMEMNDGSPKKENEYVVETSRGFKDGMFMGFCFFLIVVAIFIFGCIYMYKVLFPNLTILFF